MKMITGPEAISKIEREFPELREELHDETWDGLLHLQISVFSRLAQSVIDAGNRASFHKICELFLLLFNEGDADLINALNVSFLEHLNLKDGKIKRAWALREMPNKMRIAFEEMAEYNQRLHERR